ncbi:MAG: glycosyltransferase family 1 protein [Ignavibacteriae bacterium]|nr:glycosyltransferase family 1 protein [Ignavibacteriota bacterium]
MKILLVGSDSNYSIEKYYLKYLGQEPGVICDIFTAQNLFLDYYQRSLTNKIIFRLGYKNIYKSINYQLLKKIENFSPDVLFVFKGMEILPKTLTIIKKKGIFLANYNPDNPFIFSGRGSGNKNISNSIGLYDLHFTYHTGIQSEIENVYKIPSILLPFGFELPPETDKIIKDCQEIQKVCFIGNPDKYRSTFITNLANLGLEIDVYGNNWSKYVNHKNISVNRAVFELEFWNKLRTYRVQLNYMRPHNLESHNMRSFEIPAIGGIQVAPNTFDHRTYFINGENIFLYNNELECYKICVHLLHASKISIMTIRENAMRHSFSNNYSYRQRAKIVYNTLANKVN